MARPTAIERIDKLLTQLQTLQNEAQEIFNDYVDQMLRDYKSDTSFGCAKYELFAIPAGSALNYIAGLRLVREKLAQPKQKRTTPKKELPFSPDPIRIGLADECEVADLLIENGMLTDLDRPSMARAVSSLLDVLAFEARCPNSISTI
jgi:hypothetical protein